MEHERPLSGYKYQVSPKYNNYDFKGLKTPQIVIKNETNDMIVNQAKESLQNFLTNLKNSSILKENSENKNINVIPKLSGLSSISNSKIPDDFQNSYESFNFNNNKETNLLNYKNIYNNNFNTYNVGNKALLKNRAKPRLNNQIEQYQQFHEKLNTESDLILNLNNNNIYNTINSINRNDYYKSNKFNSVNRSMKYNHNLSKSKNKSEKSKNIILNLIEKIKILKEANSQNKKDILNLIEVYNNTQKNLLEQINLFSIKEQNEKKNKEIINEKDIKIKELEKKLQEMNNNEEKEHLIEKNKSLKKEIDNLNNEIKKLNKNNQELQKLIKIKDITLEKYNEDIKDLEEKLKKFNDKDFVLLELKEKEDELNKINSSANNKYKSYQSLLIEYKRKNEELLKENKNITGQNLILTSQKKSLTKENANYKLMLEDFKINNEKLIKERDEYKIKKEKLINEIEIIKLNNDKLYNIKSITNNNTNKLKNEINSLKREKEILDEQNQVLQKRIKSLDKKNNSRNKSLNVKSKTSINLKSDKFKKFTNLKIIKNKESEFSLNNKNNKNINKKNASKKGTKKLINKFKKLSIANKVVDIFINKKNINNNKKPKKIINKFKKLVKCNKIVDVLIKNTPKPVPKSKKKKFLKLKSVNEVVNICLKPKINNKKFKSKLLKVSSKINNLNIHSINKTKKKIELNKSKTEYIFYENTEVITINKKNEEAPIKEEIKSDNNEISKSKEKVKNIIYEIKKLETFKYEGKIKSLILEIKNNENFALKKNSNIKKQEPKQEKNLIIGKNQSITYLHKIKELKKLSNYEIKTNNYFNLIAKEKPKRIYEISETKNNINYDGIKRAFYLLEKSSNDNILYLIAKKDKKIISYEISKNNEISFNESSIKKIFKIANSQNLIYRAVPKKNTLHLKKVTTMSMILKPNKKVLLSKTFNENTSQNKPKLVSFFSSFLKPKKSSTIPVRVLTVTYMKNPKQKINEFNKKSSITSQTKFNFISKNKKDKNIYKINNTNSFNYINKLKKTIYTINIINSFKIEKSKKNFNLSSLPNPDLLKCDEDLKQLITELNLAITLKNEEIKRLEKEKSDTEIANQLFNDSSTEQIESLSNSLSLFKEKSEKLNEENENLKSEIDKNKVTLEEKKKEFEENKNNLNKTIEQLTKENSQLKLDLFKKGTEQSNDNKEKEEKDNNNLSENNDKDKKINELEKQIETLKEDMNKLRQSKIIETNQLKLEMTKSKVEIKRLTNQIKKLESEKVVQNNDKTQTLENTDLKGSSINKDEISKLKDEIENYKNKISELDIEVKKNEELRHQNIMYYNKLQEAQKKVSLANQVIDKAKKFNFCIAYVSEFLKEIQPSNDRQTFLVNKLKVYADEYQKEKDSKKHK